MIQAIETEYNGYRFRSRAEARWAVFFDKLGVKYEYEKEGYSLGAAGWYLPDFWLPDLGYWVEIKGADPTGKERDRARALCVATGASVLIFSGAPWFSIARAYFVLDEGACVEVANYYCGAQEDDTYDYSEKNGEGCYYQGWHTWGISSRTEEPTIVCLAERDDVREATHYRVVEAYAASRSARFEHGESPR